MHEARTIMESALQVDLARSEAPADQILDSALGQAATHPMVISSHAVREGTANDKSEHSIRGRSETTAQVRLVPKKPKDQRSRSPSAQDAPTNTLELGNFDETAPSFSLHPVDEGFGAWSYVASAFAMFIVVWGMLVASRIVIGGMSLILDSQDSPKRFRSSKLIFHLKGFRGMPTQ